MSFVRFSTGTDADLHLNHLRLSSARDTLEKDPPTILLLPSCLGAQKQHDKVSRQALIHRALLFLRRSRPKLDQVFEILASVFSLVFGPPGLSPRSKCNTIL